MHPSFNSNERASALAAARARNNALAAAGLCGAAAVLFLNPIAAHAQSSGGTGGVPYRASYLPANAPAQLIDQDYHLRLMQMQARLQRQADLKREQDQAKLTGVPLAPKREEQARRALVAYRRQMASGANGLTKESVQAYQNALLHRDQMPTLAVKDGGGAAAGSGSGGGAISMATRINIGSTKGPWEFVGPQNLFPQIDQTTGGLLNPLIGNQDVSGRINAVAYDPKSGKLDLAGNAAPEVFYAATANGGIWRYTQGSNHPVPPTPSTAPAALTYGQWEPLSDYSFPVLETSAIAVNPVFPRILYAGTGDYPGRQGLGYGYGIMRSTDAGKTWLNVGNGNPGVTVGTVPPTQPTNAPIMEGTSVSAIIIDPDTPSLVMASTGRGIREGGLWRSVDGGDTWVDVSPRPGNWSKVDYSASTTINANGIRTYYASLENVGVFRSDDRGLTWNQLTNLPLVYSSSLLVSASKLPHKPITDPNTAQGSEIIYVLEASQFVNDGRQFKSLDKGVTWIEITGLPTAVGFDNNFSAADYSLNLMAATVPVTNYLGTPDVNGIYPTLPEEALYGSGRTFAGARGGITLDGTNILPTFDPITQFISPTLFDLGASPPFVDISQSLGPGRLAHVNQHGSAVSPQDDQRVLTANDGGISRFIYSPGYIFDAPPTYLFQDNVSAWAQDPENINSLLGITSFEQADFIASSPTNFFVVGGLYQNQAVYGALTFSGTTPTSPALSGTSWNLIPQVPPGNASAIVPDTPTTPNTNGVPFGTAPGVKFVHTNSALYFNPFDTTGNSQFGSTSYTGSISTNGQDYWPNARLYWTTSNWATGQDITPDRYFTNGQPPYNPLPNFAGASVNIYNSNDPIDTATATNWRGEPKPPITKWAFGTAHVFNTRGPVVSPVRYFPQAPSPFNPARPVVYIGTNRLWRFDPPGQATVPLLPGTTSPATPPNRDRGIWRRVGGTQLATGTGTISAITVVNSSATREGSVAYVGTTNGELWVSPNLTADDGATLPLPPLTAGWTLIGGPGSGNATLPSGPNNPITSISLNSAPNTATFGDILVGLGGNPRVGGPARVYRATNTLGVPLGVTPVFTAQGGQGFASLPDVPVNDITRDPDDPTNTIFAATDVGVFASTNAGATWANATAPLGLPNVRCTSIKAVSGVGVGGGTGGGVGSNRFLMVSTYGRGVFRFDLNNLLLAATNPNLTFTQTLSRSNGLVVVNLTILNSGATAQNVNLTGASLTVGTTAFSATNLPLSIGSVGPGQSTTVALRFPVSVGRAGTAVVLKVNGTYILPPFPPGTTVNFNNGAGVRTRLP